MIYRNVFLPWPKSTQLYSHPRSGDWNHIHLGGDEVLSGASDPPPLHFPDSRTLKEQIRTQMPLELWIEAGSTAHPKKGLSNRVPARKCMVWKSRTPAFASINFFTKGGGWKQVYWTFADSCIQLWSMASDDSTHVEVSKTIEVVPCLWSDSHFLQVTNSIVWSI